MEILALIFGLASLALSVCILIIEGFDIYNNPKKVKKWFSVMIWICAVQFLTVFVSTVFL